MPTIQLIEHLPLCSRARQFTFQAPFRHEAGQYVGLSAVVRGTQQMRYYSIASPPRPDGRIDFCIRCDGDFGSHLSGLRLGDSIESSEPGGKMRLLDAGRSAVYFAAGTGIAPMRAILLAQLAENPQADITLVLGARHSAELLFREELESLATHHAGLLFLPTVSGPDTAWAGRRGRVTAHVAEATGGRSGLDAYFSGQPEMVAELRTRLATAGITDTRQCFERY